MSAPFLALTWPNAAGAAARAAARIGGCLADAGWAPTSSRTGLSLWGRAERPLPCAIDAPQDAVIVGRRFGGRGPSPGRDPRASVAASIVARARALVAGGWGAYAALLHDPAADRWWVLRDPSGALEVFTWRLGDVAICASTVAEVPLELLPARVGLDWRVIAQALREPAARDGHPPLVGLERVVSGGLQPVDGGEAERIDVWRPGNWAAGGDPADPGWARQLPETLVQTLQAMAAPYNRIATEASGGLDSSIVNAALVQAGLGDRVVAALHYVGDRPEADERRWASDLCALWDLPLACIGRDASPFDPDADFSDLSRDVRPPFGALDGPRDRDTAARLQEVSAQALVTGKGGDALFFQMPTPRVLADLWRARGPAAIRHPLNGQLARVLRRSVWSVWREALLTPLEPAAPPPGRFAGWALRQLRPGPPHPWLADLGAVPPAKQIQIRALTNGQVAQGAGRRGAADRLHPLLSQPMLELCLSVPSFELVRGGRDRALAREAFAPWLPASIVDRRSKGGLTSWYSRRVAASAPALREHLLDGVLARAGLLDGAAMEAALDPDDLIRSPDAVDLIGAAAMESWVRYWQTRVPDAAGAGRWQG